MVRWMDGKMDGWMESWMDGKMDGKIRYHVRAADDSQSSQEVEADRYSHQGTNATAIATAVSVSI